MAFVVEQDVGGGKGAMAAELDLLFGAEPTDQVVGGAGYFGIKGGRREVVLRGDLLHLCVVGPVFQGADGGGVTGEEIAAEGVDVIDADGHGVKIRRDGVYLVVRFGVGG